MSFGFSIGDFVAVGQLAHKIRKDFGGAPSQFKSLADETKTLSMVLQDVDVTIADSDLSAQQETNLQQAGETCQRVLEDLQRLGDKFSDMDSTQSGTRKSSRRVWKRLKWEPEEARELRDRISSSVTMLTTLMNQVSAETTMAVKKGVDDLNQHQDSQKRLEILDWLSPIDYAAQQQDNLKHRQEGTGLWLFESTEYKAWKASCGQTLFCPGIPGAGKTVLSSSVIEELTNEFQENPDVGVAYVYFNYRQQETQTCDRILASLLRQLVAGRSTLPDKVQDLYDVHKRNRTALSSSEVSQNLRSVLALYGRVFIVLDALDECSANDGSRDDILSGLFELQTTSSANFLCTSRHIPEIETLFSKEHSVEVRAQDQDVRKYLDSQLRRLPGFVRRDPGLQDRVKDEIVKAVDGMFLLAQLHLESLMHKRSPNKLLRALEGLPQGSNAYDHAYEDTMKRIEAQFPDQAELAKDALLWIVHAKRPLETLEFRHALAVEPGAEDIEDDDLPNLQDVVTACGGLVTVDEESDIVRLVHYTTQEFFQRTRETWFPQAEDQITEVCLTYLTILPFRKESCGNWQEYLDRISGYAFLWYAIKNWGLHAHNCRQPMLSKVVDIFQSDFMPGALVQALFVGWSVRTSTSLRRFFQRQNSHQVGFTWFHLAAYSNAPAVVRELIAIKPIDQKDNNCRTPLSYAAEFGHDAIVQLLLEHRIDDGTYVVNPNSRDEYARTPLSFAAKNGHEKVVELLVKTDNVDLNARGDYGCTPLGLAVERGHEKVAELLLRIDNVDPNARDDDGCTPLWLAVERGHEKVAELLLRIDNVDPNARDDDGCTPLLLAVERGHEKVVELLLKMDNVDLNARDDDGLTPLSYAAQHGHATIVEMLLRTGKVDIDSRDNHLRTPLSYAAEYGHATIFEMLLRTGKVDIDSRDNHLRTPLSYAARRGSITVVEILLNTGKVSIDFKCASSKEYPETADRTALSFAAEYGHIEVVRKLLDTGEADPDSKTTGSYTYGQTPLSFAVLGSCRVSEYYRYWAYSDMSAEDVETTVRLLLETGKVEIDARATIEFVSPGTWGTYNVDRRILEDQTALLFATRGAAPIGVVRLLLEHGADVHARGKDGETPLSNLLGHTDVDVSEHVKLLLDYGATPLEDERASEGSQEISS
ncbi:hypothetical protein FZEAL_1072 [Fusarium zealandicum]|uniref:NACHT domain-containing protein n=1 Tax=Fusarium zealandicum TaxID=1053134 RepID=A0A8H4UU72_9HYPO|nr:hypothetical protein FZEAL_1072 [Fusarium zealandicum]